MTFKRLIKRYELPAGETSLEVLCLRDGSLDADLDTGEVFSVRGDKRRPRRLRPDADGYLQFNLNRECRDCEGKAEEDCGRLRFRKRRCVFVHRLVKIKHLACARGGRNWRQHIADLPRGLDVNHLDKIRHHNWCDNLELQPEEANRARRELTPEEAAALAEFNA